MITEQQYNHLKHITDNSISLSAFSGMIFNSLDVKELTIKERIIKAIEIKQEILDLINEYEKENKK